MAQNNPLQKKKKPFGYQITFSLFLAAVGMAGGLLAQNMLQEDVAEPAEKKPATAEDFRAAAERLFERAQDRYDAKLLPLYQHPEKSIMRPLSASVTCHSEKDAVVCGDLVLRNLPDDDVPVYTPGFSISRIVSRDRKTGNPDIISRVNVAEDKKSVYVISELKNTLIPNDVFTSGLFVDEFGKVVSSGSYQAISSSNGKRIGTMETEPFVPEETMKRLAAYAKETRDTMMARMAKQLAKGQHPKR